MMNKTLSLLLFLFLLIISPLTTTTSEAQSTFSEKTAVMEKYDGFFTYWWDDETGKIWLEIENLDQEFIYVNSLAAGVGSNDIGLDRSQLGGTRIVKFTRVGPKILMIHPNYDFRATSGVTLEEKSVDEAFAQSVLFGFDMEATEDDRILIDLTDFLMQDAHGVADRIRSNNQGSYSIDASRSAIYLPGTFNFPKNSEFETILTLTGSGAGGWLRSVTPSSDAVTVRQHHSFVELPDDNFTPRAFDPRSGFFPISYQDYSAPIGDEMTKRYIVRHRLEKKDPTAEFSEAVEPIIFYLDNGTPEPIRTALLDGGRWWNQAFEAAGYIDAFQIKMLPDDAHPLDIRYNVINWVHRSTRGWSYGSSVVDPRTGEIIKGNVLLGSLRVRQDFMIAEGLLAPYEEGVEPDPQMLEMALNRIRQLSAHEIGHTLGIAHNFAASVNDLASVMDYPHPMATLNDDGSLSLENAYDNGIGEWDKRTVIWGYQDFPDGVNETDELDNIISETIDMGLLYLSDDVARPQGGSHPTAHLWEYGTDPLDQLDHIMNIRKAALAQFGERNIQMGRTMASLEDVLVPIYLFHRYQTEATVKIVGGVDYTYNLRGDQQSGPSVVDADRQRAALRSLFRTLDPSELALSTRILDLIPPRPIGIQTTREHFRGYNTPILDPVAMAEIAAQHTSDLLLNPNRASRLTLQHALDSNQPSLQDVIDLTLSTSIKKEMPTGYHGSIQRGINTAVVRSLLQLAANRNASPDAQAISSHKVTQLHTWLQDAAQNSADETTQAHFQYLGNLIQKFSDDPSGFETPPAPYTPPGSPIGSGSEMHLLMCNF